MAGILGWSCVQCAIVWTRSWLVQTHIYVYTCVGAQQLNKFAGRLVRAICKLDLWRLRLQALQDHDIWALTNLFQEQTWTSLFWNWFKFEITGRANLQACKFASLSFFVDLWTFWRCSELHRSALWSSVRDTMFMQTFENIAINTEIFCGHGYVHKSLQLHRLTCKPTPSLFACIQVGCLLVNWSQQNLCDIAACVQKAQYFLLTKVLIGSD